MRKIEYLLFLLFFTSTDTILFGTNSNKIMLFVPRILGVLAIFIIPHYSKTKRASNRRLDIICAFMVCIMIISSILNEDEWTSTISKLISLVTGYSIARNIYFKIFSSILEKTVVFISIIAIVVEVISYIAPLIINVLPSVVNEAGTIYKVLFIGSIPENFLNKTLIRSNGIFWEAGAFASYLIWTLMILLFYKKNYNYKYLIILLITLFITFSTTGYFTFIVLAIAYLMSGSKRYTNYMHTKKIFIGSIFIITIGIILGGGDLIFDMVFGKLGIGSEMDSSAQTRFSSFFNGINAFLINPFFGGGNNTEEMMELVMNSKFAKYGGGGLLLTNTFIANFVCFGVFFGGLFLMGTIKYLNFFSQKRSVLIILSIAFLMSYSGERFFSFMPFSFMFYGFSYMKQYEKDINHKLSS